MKRSLLAVFGAAVIASLGANWGARAAVIDFGAAVAGGAVTYVGSSLDQSTLLDLDEATLLVTEIAAGDASGLALFDTIMLSAATVPVSSQIIYGSGTGPGPLGADVILSWPIGGSGSDAFTETLTTVASINRSAANEIVITLSGTVSDTDGVFMDSPVTLILSATQAGGPGQSIVASFSNTSQVAPAVPEASTWAMMALGFGGLGYAAARRRRARTAMLRA